MLVWLIDLGLKPTLTLKVEKNSRIVWFGNRGTPTKKRILSVVFSNVLIF